MGNTECAVRAAAWTAHAQNKLNQAEQLYRKLLETQHPSDLRDAVNLGALLRQQGRFTEAIRHYEYWLKQFPDAQPLRLNGINVALDMQYSEMAERWVAEGLRKWPKDAKLLQSHAKILAVKGQLEDAQHCLEQLIQSDIQETAGIWLDLGQILHQRRKLKDSLVAFDKATAVEPNEPRSHASGITVLKELGQPNKALERWQQLPASLKETPIVQSALAGVWMELQDLEKAESLYNSLCCQEPGDVIHWLNHAACLRGLIRINACHRVLKRALILHPGDKKLKLAFAQCLSELGRQSSAVGVMRRLLDQSKVLEDGLMINVQFHAAGYQLMSSKELQTLARRWEKQKQRGGIGPLWADYIVEASEERPLRIGYFSADFANHPVGRFLLPIIQQHDRSRVHVIGLSHGPHSDNKTAQLKEACDDWVDLRYHSDLWAARMIADKRLDVLIELGGYTGHSRPGILIHRPARVQLSYLGYYAPTYLDSIDGWIGDEALFDGLNSTDNESHRLHKIINGYMSFTPENLPPIEERCETTRFRFGSFNHSRKLTKSCIELFCAVLAANPESDLILKSISFSEEDEQQRISSLFEECGLAKERLIILPWVKGWENHIKLYKEIDVALDPIPYGGATTTCEALLMGVPVLSLAGNGMVGRLSASVLTSAGQTRWIAKNKLDYIFISKQALKNGPRNKEERIMLRESTQKSNLGNPKQLAGSLEKIYSKSVNIYTDCRTSA
jgi:protein O-GlcNAc transferase